MKTTSSLFGGFIDNRASMIASTTLEQLQIDGNPIELLVNALTDLNVSTIYKVKNLFILGDVVDLQVETDNGAYSLRILEKTDNTFEVRVQDLKTYAVLNTFTLSKLQPSGLPDGD